MDSEFWEGLVEDPKLTDAQYWELSKGNSSPVDRFTGCQTAFRPFVLGRDYWDEDPATNPPPQLPGTDPEKRLHFARGTKSGPLYVSPNVQTSDPFWLRLAYMRYPLNFEGTRALLESLVPSRASEQGRWWCENEALAALRAEFQGPPFEYQLISLFRTGSITPRRGHPQEATLPWLWSQYQHLAISTLWTWGLPHEHLQLAYCTVLAEEVGQIYQDTHPLLPMMEHHGQNNALLRTSVIEVDRARFKLNGTRCWRTEERPPSVARVAEGLSEVIGSAGAFLAGCPQCDRLYWRPYPRKLFCGPYCRNAYNRKATQRGQTGGRRAQEREKRQEEEQRLTDWR